MTPLTAFDADVLIYSARKGDPLGARVAPLFQGSGTAGIGSVLLLTEVLAKPMREHPDSPETDALAGLIGRIDLRPLDDVAGWLALTLAITYRLRAADAAHLATAVAGGADRFLTNNRKDFPRTIKEIDVIYPEDLSS